MHYKHDPKGRDLREKKDRHDNIVFKHCRVEYTINKLKGKQQTWRNLYHTYDRAKSILKKSTSKNKRMSIIYKEFFFSQNKDGHLNKRQQSEETTY